MHAISRSTNVRLTCPPPTSRTIRSTSRSREVPAAWFPATPHVVTACDTRLLAFSAATWRILARFRPGATVRAVSNSSYAALVALVTAGRLAVKSPVPIEAS
jgi:hypothetical protein